MLKSFGHLLHLCRIVLILGSFPALVFVVFVAVAVLVDPSGLPTFFFFLNLYGEKYKNNKG